MGSSKKDERSTSRWQRQDSPHDMLQVREYAELDDQYLTDDAASDKPTGVEFENRRRPYCWSSSFHEHRLFEGTRDF